MAKQRQSFDESTKSEGSGGGSSKGGNTVKLIVVLVALAAAGGLLAWHFGLLDRPEPPPPPLEASTDPDTQKAIEKSAETNKQLERIRKAPSGS
ncbi:MAG: hypothetical protein HBSAPP03_26100 [Phycisphaerae bacterium]|nr:MAG: hypothetical protein HBSAPP03_26100 [Phycisphaerae bacterium]